MVNIINKYYDGFPLCFESYEIKENIIILNFKNVINEEIKNIKVSYKDIIYSFDINNKNEDIECVIKDVDTSLIGSIELISVETINETFYLKDYQNNKKIIKPKSVYYLGRERQLYINEFSKKNKYPKKNIKYIPTNNENYWTCVCGNTNFGESSECSNCKIRKEKVFAIPYVYGKDRYESVEYIKMNSFVGIWSVLVYMAFVLSSILGGDFLFDNMVKNSFFGVLNRFIMPLTIIISSVLIVIGIFKYIKPLTITFKITRFIALVYLNIVASIFTIKTAYNSVLLWGIDIIFIVYVIYEGVKVKKINLFKALIDVFIFILLIVNVVKIGIYSKYDLKVLESGLEYTIKSHDEQVKIPEELDNIKVKSAKFLTEYDYNIKVLDINKSLVDLHVYSNSILPTLIKINVDKDNKYFKEKDNILYTIDNKIKLVPANITKIVIDYEKVENRSLMDCVGLEEIVIKNNVKEIGNNAFYGCNNLKRIVFEEGSTLEKIGEFAFGNCSNLTLVDIPKSVEKMGTGVFYGCNSLEKLRVPFIGNMRENDKSNYLATDFLVKMFGQGDYLQYKIVPESLKEVEVYDVKLLHNITFYNIKSLEKVILPSFLEGLGGRVFYNCSNLKEIVIPEGVKEIKISCFENCTSLTKVVLPSSLEKIGVDAFKNCPNIKEVVFEKDLNSIIVEEGNEDIKR